MRRLKPYWVVTPTKEEVLSELYGYSTPLTFLGNN